MNPWLWFWSPQFYFPFSGSVVQRIDPETEWFFDGIKPQSGNGELEKQIFDVASYGRQLGWITEVLLGSHSDDTALRSQAADSLSKLRKTYVKIEAVKDDSRAVLAQSAASALEKLFDADPAAYELLMASAPRLEPLSAPRLPARKAR